jgi:hypothetical protein
MFRLFLLRLKWQIYSNEKGELKIRTIEIAIENAVHQEIDVMFNKYSD